MTLFFTKINYYLFSPPFLLFVLSFFTALITYFAPSRIFENLFSTHKYYSINTLLYTMILSTVILFPIILIKRTKIENGKFSVNSSKIISFWYLFGVFLFLFSIFIWVFFAINRIGGLSSLFLNVTKLFLSPTVGLSDYLKKVIFEPIQGISSFSNLGISITTLYCIKYFFYKNVNTLEYVSFLLFISLSIIRSLVLSERIAFLYIIMIFFIFYARKLKFLKLKRILLGIFLIILVIFSTAEYFRSWNYYKYSYNSYFEFIFQRFFGYYSTSLNNSAYFLESKLAPLQYSLIMFINLPFIGDFFRYMYENLFHTQYFLADVGNQMSPYLSDSFSFFLNPEFNNIATIPIIISDFGIFSILIVFLFSLISLKIYISFTRNKIFGLIFYPLIFLFIIESPRIYLFSSTSTLMNILFLISTYFSIKLSLSLGIKRIITREPKEIL